jgi:hypothetical protein
VKTKARLKKYLVRGIAVFAIFISAGYFSAWVSLSECHATTKHALENSDLHHANMDGTVITYKDIRLESKVAFPFVVKSYYWVPHGMHGRYHEYRYLAFFGFVKQYGYISYSII